MKNRNSNIELLRIVAALMVAVLHYIRYYHVSGTSLGGVICTY